jgi:hypothetical protein
VSAQVLCVGLRFRPEFSARQWARTLRGILAWEPTLEPTHVTRRDDPSAPPREPWSDELWPVLGRRLAEEPSWSWALEHLDGAETSLEVGRGLHQADVLIALDRPAGDPAGRLLALHERIAGGAEPALGWAYDCHGPDAELAVQGLQRLVDLAPVLYLDARAVEHVGGRERLRVAPCRVLDAPAGGLLLHVRDPFSPPTETDRRVAELLGLPLSFLE